MSDDRSRSEIERATLGACMHDASVVPEVEEILLPEMFSVTNHTRIYNAILELVVQGVEPDQVSLLDKLTKDGSLDQVGGAASIANLAGEIATAVNATYQPPNARRATIAPRV